MSIGTTTALPKVALSTLRHTEFPVAERYTYLNHAALGPLPRRTADAIAELVQDMRDHGSCAEAKWCGAVERTRRLVARMINAAADDVAFTRSTSQGLSIVAASLPWQRGDVVVTVRGEFPSNVFPWLALQHQGVQVRFVEPRNGRICLNDLDAALAGARLLAISWVQHSNGFRIDLGAVSEICQRRGALLSLDAMQGVGALPLDLHATPVDFCAFGAHKWLLAPQGVGALYVNPRVRDRLRSAPSAPANVTSRDYTTFNYDEPLTTAGCETGVQSLIGLVGLEQSLQLLLEVGPSRIAAHLADLTDYLAQRLLAKDYRLLTPLEPANRSGIVAFNHLQRSSQELFDALRAVRVVGALREGGVRLSPHLYNTRADIDGVVDVL